jgi:porphyrinogen peroxidase
VVTPQFGIFTVGTSAHSFLEFTIRPDTTPLELVRAVADVQEPRTTVGGVNIVVGSDPASGRGPLLIRSPSTRRTSLRRCSELKG